MTLKASSIKILRDNDDFKGVISGVKEEQISVFSNANSSIEEIEKAHHIICALSEIETYMTRIIENDKFQK